MTARNRDLPMEGVFGVEGKCGICGDECLDPNIEAFEISGKIACEDCAEGLFNEETA